MTTEIRLPRLDADMEEADLLSWLVEPGASVGAGDLLLELETDKATVEFESPVSGTLLEIRVPAGTTGVRVDTVLCVIEERAADAAGAVHPEVPEESPPETPAASTDAYPAADEAGATALARRLAEQAGLDLGELEGTGARGRITKRDVERRLRGADAVSDAPAAGVVVPGARMATRADEQTIPHLRLLADCAADALIGVRASLDADESGARISLNDLVIRAAALALREVSEANACWNGEAIVPQTRVDIAIAVATASGLVTPILRDADRKGLATLAAEIRDLAERAQAGGLSPSEHQGGALGVTNLGTYGIDSVYPLIDPPRACVLGVGAARTLPVVRDGAVVAGSVMSLTLSADARVIDGAVGARLLAAIKRRVEQPLDMLL